MAALVSGCAREAGTVPWSVVDSAGIRVVTSSQPTVQWHVSETPLLAVGSVNDSGPTQFFRVRGVNLLDRGRVAVLNGGSESVRVFDSQGRLLLEFGRRGRGPTEFNGLWKLGERGDSFVTYDMGNDRVSVRSGDGAFGRAFQLEWFYGSLVPEYLGDSTIITTTVRTIVDLKGSGEILDSVLVSRYDYTGRLIDSIGRIPGNLRVVAVSGDLRTTLGEPFTARVSAVPVGDRICYAFGPVAEIKCLDPRGHVAEIDRVDVPPVRVTEDDIAEYWSEVRASKPSSYRSAELRVRKSMVFPEAYPAFDLLRLDDSGRIWAELYKRSDSDPNRWWVFREGHAAARVDLPAEFELFDIRGDRVAGVARDSLGVEYVRVYALEGGSR